VLVLKISVLRLLHKHYRYYLIFSLYDSLSIQKYQTKLCVKFQQLQTSTRNINEMSKSLKEFIGVTDEILGYLQRDDLLGVPKNLFKR
jgi:hypothetical protein